MTPRWPAVVAAALLASVAGPAGRAAADTFALTPGQVIRAAALADAHTTVPPDGRLRGYGFTATVTAAPGGTLRGTYYASAAAYGFDRLGCTIVALGPLTPKGPQTPTVQKCEGDTANLSAAIQGTYSGFTVATGAIPVV